jgi:hypothetical protein
MSYVCIFNPGITLTIQIVCVIIGIFMMYLSWRFYKKSQTRQKSLITHSPFLPLDQLQTYCIFSKYIIILCRWYSIFNLIKVPAEVISILIPLKWTRNNDWFQCQGGIQLNTLGWIQISMINLFEYFDFVFLCFLLSL